MSTLNWLPKAGLAVVVLAYLHNTLPYLTMLPRVNVDEPWLMQRAYQVLTVGIPNQPMLGLDRPYFLQVGYDYLYAPWFAAFGLGMWQARLLSVILGLGAVLCIYGLGRRLLSVEVGLMAAALLVADSNFLGNARTSRTDMPSVFCAVTALWCFLCARDSERRRWHVLAGALAGFAMLCHGNAYWVVLVLIAWYAITYGPRNVATSSILWCALGGLLTFGPYLLIVVLNWHEVQVQIGNFAGDRAPSLSPAVIWDHVQREPQRYAGWYFGLVTNAVPNPFLRVFQVLAAAGVVFVVGHMVARRGRRAEYALLSVLAFGVAIVFAGFIPNKAHVYMPNILVGLSLAGAALVVALVNRVQRRSAVVTIALAVGYCAASVAYYQIWYSSQRRSELVPYEKVARAIELLVPAGSKDLFASPNLWVPFHADEGVRFRAYTGATPVPVDGRHRLRGFGVDRSIHLVVDESEWKTVLTNPLSGYSDEWRQAWATYIAEQCTLRGVSYGTSYGNLASYECANEIAPAAAPLRIVGDGIQYRLGAPVWAPTDEQIAALPQYVDPRRPADAALASVEVADDAVRVQGTHWPGLQAELEVRAGEPYLLTIDAESARESDLVILGRWDQPQVTTLLGAGAAGIVGSFAETSWFPNDRAFIATAPNVLLRLYSEGPAASFRLRSLGLYRLEPVAP